MPSVNLYSATGEAHGTIDLDAKVFGLKPNPGLIEEVVVAHLANRRVVTAHTKTKGEVRGGGRKPWRQKGTGRARHGSIRSPQWKGGGVIFGPRSNRNFDKKVNVKAKRKALLMVLSDKAANQRLAVVEGVNLPEPKTKHVAGWLKQLPRQASTLVILPASQPNLVKAGRNIPGLSFVRADSLNVYDTLNHRQLFVFKDALPTIGKLYARV